ncbi:MAG: hypothetical protein WEC79_06440 [Thermomicrobiales bacterium]
MSEQKRQVDSLHDSLLLLDRLEELREDMEELGVATLEELRRRIVELEAQLDDEDRDEADDGSV